MRRTRLHVEHLDSSSRISDNMLALNVTWRDICSAISKQSYLDISTSPTSPPLAELTAEDGFNFNPNHQFDRTTTSIPRAAVD